MVRESSLAGNVSCDRPVRVAASGEFVRGQACNALEGSKGSRTQPTLRIGILHKVKPYLSVADVEMSPLAVKGADSPVAVITGLSSTSHLLFADSAQHSSNRQNGQSARLARLKTKREYSTHVLVSPILLPLVPDSRGCKPIFLLHKPRRDDTIKRSGKSAFKIM